MFRSTLAALLSLSLASGALSSPAAFASAPTEARPATPSELVKAVDIPHERFTLGNGLTVIVHTDRKTPVVGVTTYYRVGSKHEPRGKTGFAHLYEHLFFGGSENFPSFDEPLVAAGSTQTNGSTWYDRTNYVETVPTGALELALFAESDRMGHLLGAVTQEKLDRQRGVVQNEKRQGDNQPYGLMAYAIGEGLFPVGHPYRHATIGSMADLDAATLQDVRDWYRNHYGPNNAVLVLSGDIDASTARPLVEKYFGQIPRGPDVRQVEAGPVTLPAPASREMKDQVPVVRLTRNWSGPGLNHPDAPALEIGFRILGGLAGSRLDNALVRGEQIAVAVTASAQTFEQVGFLQATMDVKPGVEREAAEKRLNEVIDQYLREGPTRDEVQRAVTSTISGEIGRLERVGGFYGKGATLAEGELYSGDPSKYKRDLARVAALTPADVKAAMQRWLDRPAFTLDVVPGERTESGAEMGGWGDRDGQPSLPADARKSAPPLPPSPDRDPPPVAPVADLDFPSLEHAKLSNGIPVTLAHRSVVPKVMVDLSFDAGYAADATGTPGTQSLMLEMLDEGTATRTATEIAEEQERLGAAILTGGSIDRSRVTLSALTANLAPSLDLLADVLRNPAFAPEEVARLKAQQAAELSQVLASPRALASRELGKLLFGQHPYAQPSDGLGNAEALASLTPAALRGAHDAWLTPERARITVVGDVSMAKLLPLLEERFGNWKKAPSSAPEKNLEAPIPDPRTRVVLIDRPNSPQSVIYAGRVLPVDGRTDGLEALDLANEVLGGDFLSRLNSDLREEKGWSYGTYSAVREPAGPRSFVVAAPVQADRTADAIKAIIANVEAFPADKPVAPAELNRVIEGNIRALPNRFETSADVLSAILENQLLGRPDDYYETLASRYRALGAQEIEAAAKRFLQSDGMTFLVVGDRRQVEPQLKTLGLPVEIMPGPDAGG